MQDNTEYAGVLYNRCYGGFSFSKEAMSEYCEKLQMDPKNQDLGREIPRTDPTMIEIVKRLGEKANGLHARIEIELIPRKYVGFFSIAEYDGYESVCIMYFRYKLHKIQELITDFDFGDGGELKRRIEAILAERGDDDEENGL